MFHYKNSKLTILNKYKEIQPIAESLTCKSRSIANNKQERIKFKSTSHVFFNVKTPVLKISNFDL